MTKIYLKIALMFVLTLVWYIGVCGVDSGHWFLSMCMVILPIALFVWACRSGRMDDVLAWIEGIGKKMNTY